MTRAKGFIKIGKNKFKKFLKLNGLEYVFSSHVVCHTHGIVRRLPSIVCVTCLNGLTKGKVVLLPAQTWNSNCPRLLKYRLCKYSTFI